MPRGGAATLRPPSALGPNPIGGEAQGRVEEIVGQGSQVELISLEARGAFRHFLFSRQLEPESLSMADGYWVVHDRAAARGEIDHSVEHCPELAGATIRRWTREDGWTEARVRVASPPGVRAASLNREGAAPHPAERAREAFAGR